MKYMQKKLLYVCHELVSISFSQLQTTPLVLSTKMLVFIELIRMA